MSPDGRLLTFVASSLDGTPRLWLRPLASLTVSPLPGTEYASLPFWSPDSRSVGFFASWKLKTINAAGGAAQTLADASLPNGGTWNHDGVIVFGADLAHPLLRVQASGGATAPVTSLDRPAPGSVHGAPFFLSDDRHFLFTAFLGPSVGSAYVGSLDSQEIKLVVNARTAIYSPPGYVLFLREPQLMAQPFDVSRLSTTGDARAVADVGGMLSRFHVSKTGTLVYRSGAAAETQLLWADRAGRILGVAASSGIYENVALSPDDTRIAFDRPGPSSTDVWLMDLGRRIESRFTFQSPNNNVAVWSPGGRLVAFATNQGVLASQNQAISLDIYQRPSNASAPDEPLLKLNAPPIMFPSDWSADGRFLTYYRTDPKTQRDEWVLPLFGDRKPFALLHSEFNEYQGQFSPDSQWIAYVSDESGGPQVYVQSFPTLTGKVQISAAGGTQPRWNHNGKELFYLARDRKLIAVAVKTGPTFEVSAPHALFGTSLNADALRQTYSVSSDGQRFLLNTPLDTASSPLTVVLNWPGLLKK